MTPNKREMVKVEVDEEVVKELLGEEIKRKIEELSIEHTFWDMKELSRQVCMSKSSILNFIFYDPRFPKYKVGQKWMMPAKETREFLLIWLKEQPRH